MKPALLAVPALLLLAAPASEISYAPEEGAVVTRSFRSSGRYTLEETSVVFDGNDVEQEAPDLSISSKETIRVTDVLGAVADGRPSKLERTFDELSRDVTYDVDGESHPEHSISDFEGVSVVFEYDADEDAYDVAAGEDDDVDQEYLDALVEDMDFRVFLPKGAVEKGDTWELEPSAYAAIMSPAGVLNFYGSEEDGVDEQKRAADLEMLENLDGEGSAELLEIREDDGARVAVLHLRFDVSSSATFEFETPDGFEGTREMEVERAGEGELLWDLERGIARSLRFEADATLTITTSFAPEDDAGQAHEITNEQVFEGKIEYEVDFELE